MREQAVIDRFEGDFIVLETDHGMIRIPRADGPEMLAESTVVWVENGRIVAVDEQETNRRAEQIRRRFERILGDKTGG